MTSKIKVDNINKVSDDSNIINKCGTTITLGASGDSIALASGASQTGFGREGSVNWVATPKTSTFTAVSGEGYSINSGSAITANLPAGSAGAIVAFSDYARNFATYNLTISANGSEKIGGLSLDAKLTVDGQAATFVYVDSTKGWVNVQNAEDTETGQSPFIIATGGTETTSGDCKIHTFTGPGTFTVSDIAAVCAPTRNQVSYLVVAGGGGGTGSPGNDNGAGGGGGGFREKKSPLTPYTASPLDGAPTITITATSFPITVGAGGTQIPTTSPGTDGNPGSPSTFSTVTSTGGGGGGRVPGNGNPGKPGGSGGGAAGGGCTNNGAGSGNTPPTSPAQGFPGGNNASTPPDQGGGGGGGATEAGVTSPGPYTAGGRGGAGATTSISGSPLAYSGGAGTSNGAASPCGTGGAGGAGTGGNNGTTNRGGGGSGVRGYTPMVSGSGGSGVVVIRYKFQ